MAGPLPKYNDQHQKTLFINMIYALSYKFSKASALICDYNINRCGDDF
jgi:hypothetical protein